MQLICLSITRIVHGGEKSKLICLLSGIIFLIAITFGMMNAAIPIKDYEVIIGNARFTASSFAVSSMTNVIIFWTRSVVHYIRFPRTFAIVSSHVSSMKVSKEESVLLQEAFSVREWSGKEDSLSFV